MKKTMFITSVIMVVVLAIALTTSSLAWFSAGGNKTVSVQQFTVQAKNNAAAAGLEISNNKDANWKTTNISLLTGEEPTNGIARDGFVPMVPVGTLAEDSETHKLSASDLYKLLRGEMYTAQVKTVDGAELMATAPTAANIAFDRVFYVRNTGESAATVNTNLTVAVTSSQSSRTYNANLFVAIFDEEGVVYTAKTNESEATMTGTPKLLNLVGNDNKVTFCNPTTAWAADATSSSVNSQQTTIANIEMSQLSLEAGTPNASGGLDLHPHTIRVLAWFDGQELNNQNSDTTIEITISFSIPD